MFVKSFLIVIFILWGWWMLASEGLVPSLSTSTPEKARISPEESKRFASVGISQSAVLQSLREPDSVEWISALSNQDGALICFQYRARNGMGGMTVASSAVFMGKIVNWKKFCSGKKELFDMTHAIQ